ncbi:MAG: glutathione synthase [Pseudomonadota bacterium]|nr:glutathione synthase [Pseudomonadota bacterium]
MSLTLGVLMDPIAGIRAHKDSSVAMLVEATRRGHRILYASPENLRFEPGRAYAHWTEISAQDNDANWYRMGDSQRLELGELDVLLLRRDPPVNSDFLADTLWASLGNSPKPLIINNPQALRDCNEKLFALQFPQCCPPTLVARDAAALKTFVATHDASVLKPLDGMAGHSIFRTFAHDPNLNVILETLTAGGRHFALAQKFIPEIAQGDKRILMIEGEPVPYSLARIPQGGDFRGNLARGGRGVAQLLSERDRWICAQVAPELKRRGLVFVGLDVIGDYLTEINVTSPTGIRDIDAQSGLNIAGMLFDAIERRLA